MKCIPSEHTLKNGSVIIARSFMRRRRGAGACASSSRLWRSDNLSRYPDEIRITPEEERTILQKQEENPKGILLGAFVENQLVAMASVLPVSDSHERYRHRGGFGISVLQGYWNQGIASLLIPRVLECAHQAGYEQVELEVLTDNEKAIISLSETWLPRIWMQAP